MNNYKNISECGITPNATVPCARELNRLFSEAHRSWYIPEGTYLIEETLRLPSRTSLKIHPHAILRLANNAAQKTSDYLLTNSDHENGNYSICIEGGQFDGNQIENPRPAGLLDQGYSGAMLHFQNVHKLELLNTKLTNAEAYYARFTHVHDFRIENIEFDSDKVRPNNDGIHLGGNCSKGHIRGLRANTPGVTGDDLVALNADDALQRTEVRGMTNGPIENIIIEDIEARDCHTFIRLLSIVSPIRNVTIKNVRGGCSHCAINADGARGCRVPVFDEANPPFSDGVGLLEHIQASNLKVWKTSVNTHALIDIQERLSDFTVTQLERIITQDKCIESPTLRLYHIKVQSLRLNEQQNHYPIMLPFETKLQKIMNIQIN